MEKPDASGALQEQFLGHTDIHPFENIALAFSGGGFRAATFALGVLSYFNKIEFDPDDAHSGQTLLQRVTYLSSASGGTIATALYALCNAQGKTFEAFYVKLFDTLTGDRLLENALIVLSDKKRWEKDSKKGRNIINAFSVAYDEYIFEGHTLESLIHQSKNGAHLQEVCFNTTEFYTGLSFRQDLKLVPDAGKDPYYKYGNENIYVEHAVSKRIKLADALAASSCFPGGFEPIVFPDDFTYQGLSEGALKKATTLKEQTGDKDEKKFIAEKKVGFMDGGITDNQALQSMMYADGRRIRRETSFSPFDLMLVNDVGSYFIKPYVVPELTKHRGINLTWVYRLIFFIFVIGLALAGIGIHCHRPVLDLIGGLVIVIPAIFLWFVSWLKKKIVAVSESPTGFTEKIIKLMVRYFTKTPIVVLKQMLEARAESVLMLNMSIFMKRIRQLIYNKFYESPEWKNRGKGNHIYDLSFSSDLYRKRNPPLPYLEPSRDIKIVAQTAFNMGTTLWFDEENTNQQHSEACIIACGQFTTCYNLLSYIEKLLKSESSYHQRLLALKKQLSADYELFKTDPFFKYNQDGINYKIPKFQPLSVKDIPFPSNW
ncbi:MAG: patatin-like phospholipase family protein [Sphingobacteriales bacterium]